MTTYVFAGPSVPRQARERFARHAVLLPPVAAGDLLRLPARPGDVVGVIDGFFHRRPAVRHKEILALLAAGVRVHGAASMGALRAAELADFGMIGHGRVFAGYRDATIIADDEVALLHGTEEEDYAAYTEALVNVRFALADAAARGEVSGRAARSVLRVAARMPFAERTRAAIIEAARRTGMDGPALAAVAEVLGSAPDVKRQDALALLESLAGAPAPARDDTPALERDADREHLPEAAPEPARNAGRRHVRRDGSQRVPDAADGSDGSPHDGGWRLRQTVHLREWRAAARGAMEPEAGWVTETEVHRLAQVLAEDYPAFRVRAGVQALAARTASGDRAGSTGGSSGEGTTGVEEAVLEHLRALGVLAPGATSDPGLDRWCTAAELRLPEVERTCRAAARALFPHSVLTFGDPFLEALQASGAYATVRARLTDCVRFHRALRREHPTLRTAQLRPEKIIEHFARRWGRDDLEDAVLERGFATVAEFVATARVFYLYDKAHPGVPPLILGDR
ncbi:hypothetical protein Sme01_01520 [Sphaerisporangium melleum]|uniref:TfuA-like core domain-containing protein n=1 Tax=Sphaerisporangium melleum TaxID=321316 RepID=A0A917R4B2_9ACTN|nr:TfuA-like protein [Sphaerisporangium melleum]GGK88404.1 hypothetical protein GCM10007964_33850 [Sphaerisporangium melleum]GII67676.1 hypothetical protein Sme01_01520 [Sphaerisporangium melleum]